MVAPSKTAASSGARMGWRSLETSEVEVCIRRFYRPVGRFQTTTRGQRSDRLQSPQHSAVRGSVREARLPTANMLYNWARLSTDELETHL